MANGQFYVNAEALREHLSFTEDMRDVDATVLNRTAWAAQVYVEKLLGWRLEDFYGPAPREPLPEPLQTAILQLAAWWFLQREAATVGDRTAEVPFGVREIVAEYRDWTF
ncbi:head-tail connector protein [uncultured Jannaschia sp.]|uniref:head-tail connector protein n=1 Tax=uncultured Jannaschia sp. TaxID=293347 RepID=UPI00261C8F2E|nr:head-tail connector protein [uncultured Jannaschia sp.]